ncbi:MULTISPECIES: T9SS type A sorting domain-containing protein [unclassified Chryseobacterium]|uniref:T9SS-dependent choice-of-anchor J family protein n=1 Tax=unclassified Chryseobacterium TaxID=2593645 RepID=UPI000F44CB08|nr:T9SS type A sorting domain-containing protein [Chryseobacterium sp. G0240]ROI05606.1 T9SS C-terminal target domain-containing protein [Chryseobacterium sp. G0240]
MKKKLFFTVFIFFCTILNANAQTVIFQEDFESPTPPDLPAGWISENIGLIPGSWQTEDFSSIADSYGFSGKLVYNLCSSYTDVLLITPTIDLPAGNTYSLTFLTGILSDLTSPLTQNAHYAVYVLPATAAFTGTETPLLEETITVANVANLKTINLSSYAGQNIKVYFRQYYEDSSDFYSSVLVLDTFKITQQAALGTLETNITASDFGIYPNPASDYVYIKSKSKIMKAEIFDGVGRKVKVVLSDNRIDVQDLLPGTYLMNVTTENKTYSQKLIKK